MTLAPAAGGADASGCRGNTKDASLFRAYVHEWQTAGSASRGCQTLMQRARRRPEPVEAEGAAAGTRRKAPQLRRARTELRLGVPQRLVIQDGALLGGQAVVVALVLVVAQLRRVHELCIAVVLVLACGRRVRLVQRRRGRAGGRPGRRVLARLPRGRARRGGGALGRGRVRWRSGGGRAPVLRREGVGHHGERRRPLRRISRRSSRRVPACVPELQVRRRALPQKRPAAGTSACRAAAQPAVCARTLVRRPLHAQRLAADLAARGARGRAAQLRVQAARAPQVAGMHG